MPIINSVHPIRPPASIPKAASFRSQNSSTAGSKGEEFDTRGRPLQKQNVNSMLSPSHMHNHATGSPRSEVFHLSLDGSSQGRPSPKNRPADLYAFDQSCELNFVRNQAVRDKKVQLTDFEKMADKFSTTIIVHHNPRFSSNYPPKKTASTDKALQQPSIELRMSFELKTFLACGPEMETPVAQKIMAMLCGSRTATPRDLTVVSVMIHQGLLSEADTIDTASIIERVRLFIDAV